MGQERSRKPDRPEPVDGGGGVAEIRVPAQPTRGGVDVQRILEGDGVVGAGEFAACDKRGGSHEKDSAKCIVAGVGYRLIM